MAVSDNAGWATINLDPRANAAAAVWQGLPDIAGIAAGAGHNLLLLRDGSVMATGQNDRDQTDVPAGLSDVVAVAAGYSHSLALRRDGTVVAWGNNARGAIDVPSELGSAIAVAGGGGHSVALMDDGTVRAWGQLGGGPADPPAELSGVMAIASGWETCYALKADGTVASWGRGRYSSRDGHIAGIAVGGEVESFCLGRKSDGSLMQVGYGGSMTLSQIPEGLAGVVDVVIGGMHCVALLEGGAVVGWGGSPVRHTVPIGLGGVTALAAGENHTLALRADGTIVAWGKNGYGQLQPPTGYNARFVGWTDGVGYVLPSVATPAHDYSSEYGAQPVPLSEASSSAVCNNGHPMDPRTPRCSQCGARLKMQWM